MRFSNLTIETKITGTFFLVALVIVSFGGFWFFQFSGILVPMNTQVPEAIDELYHGGGVESYSAAVNGINSIRSDLSDMTSITIFLVVIVLLLVLMVGYVITSTFARPLLELIKGAERIERGDFSRKIQVTSMDEMGRLATILNRMAEAFGESRDEIQAKNKRLRRAVTKVEIQNKRLIDVRKAMLNVLEDVAEEKQGAMRHAQKNDLILKTMEDGVCVVNTNGIIEFMNVAGKNILGVVDDEEVFGIPVQEIFLSHTSDGEAVDHHDTPVMRSIFLRETVHAEDSFRFKHHLGHLMEVELVASPLVTNDEVEGCIVVFRDVTKAREIDRMKSEFVSVASHQLRTPLTAIRWYNEMLMAGDLGELKEKQKEPVAMMYESVKRMIDLVKALLNVARIESGRMQVKSIPTDLSELVNTLIESYAQKIAEKKLNISVSVFSHPKKISIDPVLIGEVYSNLITNAIKYTPEKGEIEIHVSVEGDDILTKITDNGFGIPMHQQEKMFAKFFRAENIVSKDTDGTGLGLYITKAIVESSGGKIWFESEENKGTTFWFTIPKSGMIEKEGDQKLVVKDL